MKATVILRRLLLPACLILIADQLIKLFIRRFPLNAVLFSVRGVLEITHCVNTGAAFSLLSGYTALIALFSAVLLVLLLVYLLSEMHLTPKSQLILGALLGGGAGNLIDRLLWGGVTDYIRLTFIRFPVFNFADICITLSVCALAFSLLTGRMDEPSGETQHGPNHRTDR